jgi:hypothetical protein
MRWFTSDIDESKAEDKEYFKRLQKAMNKQEVQKAFYQMMMDRFNSDKVKKWNEDEIPETKTKILKIIEALPTFHKYIKEQYILKHLGINAKTDEFIQDYYNVTKDKTSKQQIGKYLTALDIKPKKLSNNAGYKYEKTHKELYDMFLSKLWIDETMDLINNDTGDQAEELNNINIFKPNSTEQKLIKSLQDEINILKKQLEEKQIKPKPKELNIDNICFLHNSPKTIFPTVSEIEEIEYSKVYPSSVSSLTQNEHYEGVDSDSENEINDFNEDCDDDDDDDNNESTYVLDIGGDYEDPILQNF